MQNISSLYVCDLFQRAFQSLDSSSVHYKAKIWAKTIVSELIEGAADHFTSPIQDPPSDHVLVNSFLDYFAITIQAFENSTLPYEFTLGCICLGLEIVRQIEHDMENGFPTSSSLCKDTIVYPDLLRQDIDFVTRASFHELNAAGIKLLHGILHQCVDTFQNTPIVSKRNLAAFNHLRYSNDTSLLKTFRKRLHTMTSIEDAIFSLF